jgi:hypothetical protein
VHRDLEIGIDVLLVVMLIEIVDAFENLLALLLTEGDRILRPPDQ